MSRLAEDLISRGGIVRRIQPVGANTIESTVVQMSAGRDLGSGRPSHKEQSVEWCFLESLLFFGRTPNFASAVESGESGLQAIWSAQEERGERGRERQGTRCCTAALRRGRLRTSERLTSKDHRKR